MKVIVIGGGPAGIMAAITASKYGNDATSTSGGDIPTLLAVVS